MDETYRKVLGAKIHRATVTHADLDYEGSISVPPQLLDAADILQYESVHVWNITNGSRFETYAIVGERGGGQMVINGAAAHKASTGDLIIVACFVHVDAKEAAKHKPSLVYVDGANAIVDVKNGMDPPSIAAIS